MKPLLFLVSLLLGVDTSGQPAVPAIGTFPTGSTNVVYEYQLAQTKSVYAMLYEYIPGPGLDFGYMQLFSQRYFLTNTTAISIKFEIQQIANETAKKAVDYYYSSRTNQFLVQVNGEDSDLTIRRVEVYETFFLENNFGAWQLASNHSPEAIAVDMAKAGLENFAPYSTAFTYYTNMTNVQIFFTDAIGNVIREGIVQRNNLEYHNWYDPAYGNDAAFSVKGQRNIYNQLEYRTALFIPIYTATNGYGEIRITCTNALGMYVERYRLENGSRIVAPTIVTLGVAGTLFTVSFVGERLSRGEVQRATNVIGLPVFETINNMIIGANGTGTYTDSFIGASPQAVYRVILR